MSLPKARLKATPLTSPERAVLLAYSKMWLSDELLVSDFPKTLGSARRSRAIFQRS